MFTKVRVPGDGESPAPSRLYMAPCRPSKASGMRTGSSTPTLFSHYEEPAKSGTSLASRQPLLLPLCCVYTPFVVFPPTSARRKILREGVGRHAGAQRVLGAVVKVYLKCKCWRALKCSTSGSQNNQNILYVAFEPVKTVCRVNATESQPARAEKPKAAESP